jgi:hypothetical protein
MKNAISLIICVYIINCNVIFFLPKKSSSKVLLPQTYIYKIVMIEIYKKKGTKLKPHNIHNPKEINSLRNNVTDFRR